jgi:transposase
MKSEGQLPQELDSAHEIILTQSESITLLHEENSSLKKTLQEVLAELRFLKAGHKREKFINNDQLLLEFSEDKELQEALEAARKEAEQELEAISYNRKKARKPRQAPQDVFPAHLPREEVEVTIPQAFQDRIDSGELFIKNYHYSETLKHIPSKMIVLRYKMPVLAFVDNPEQTMLVESEANLGEKGRYHPSVAAKIATDKFAYHLPLYRLQDIFAGSGITLNRSSLDYNLELAYEATEPLGALMLSRLLASHCIGFDDTNIKLIMPRVLPDLDPNNPDSREVRLMEKMQEAKKEQKDSLDAKMWGYTSYDPAVPYEIFDFRVSRHRDGPSEVLNGYTGYAMADCYSGNMSVILSPESKMIRMACWAHARRHVHQHQDNDPKIAVIPLALINQIYDVERRALTYGVEQRAELRARESQLYLDRLGEWLDGPLAASVLPSSKLAGSFRYMQNHWEALNVFVLDGSLPIDNNGAERMMRRVAVGRKNWLFVGSVRSGMRNAHLMSLVASAHRNDLDVAMYLESVITHMLRGTAKPEELLPDVWKIHHPEAIRIYREAEREDKALSSKQQAARRKLKSELRKQLGS